MKKRVKQLEAELNEFASVKQELSSLKNKVAAQVTKLLKAFEPIESHLSCLSCLQFLDHPLMLVCGHSICMNVSCAY